MSHCSLSLLSSRPDVTYCFSNFKIPLVSLLFLTVVYSIFSFMSFLQLSFSSLIFSVVFISSTLFLSFIPAHHFDYLLCCCHLIPVLHFDYLLQCCCQLFHVLHFVLLLQCCCRLFPAFLHFCGYCTCY